MIVLKFGGSSLENAERIRQMTDIVRSVIDQKPVLVASAHRGVTDELIRIAERLIDGSSDIKILVDIHQSIIHDLNLNMDIITPVLQELQTFLHQHTENRELTDRMKDYISSFGERLSTRIIAAYLNAKGISATQYDAYTIGMITTDVFGSATPLPEADALIKKALTQCDTIPVITGFIGKTNDGSITTLGRSGSDYTATIIGAAIGADEIQIWTDVDGVMTADPRIIPSAQRLDTLSFQEAGELAYYGAKVLHPATILPAIKKNIPVRVLNTFHPNDPGTSILSNPLPSDRSIKSIVSKDKQIIIHITCESMLLRHGYLAKIFTIFAENQIVLNMVSTSEVSLSVTADSLKGLDQAVTALEKFSQVTIDKDNTMICVVGDNISSTPGIAGDIFQAMKEAQVNVLMISQGASKINVAFMIRQEDTNVAVQALHKRFFGTT